MFDFKRERPPQIEFTWIFIPRWVLPLKMPYSTKALLGLVHNMNDKHINLYKSFSNQEIADGAGISYNTVASGKKLLAERGYVSGDGEVLKNG